MDKKSFTKGTLVGVLAMCILLALCVGGKKLASHFYDRSHGIKEETVEQKEESPAEATQAKLKTLDALIDKYYLYEDEIDEEAQKDGIYAGYIAGLGDEYSYYYDKEKTKQLREVTTGEYAGIGAVLQVDKKTGLILVVEVYEDTPAERAGLKNNDLIAAVDGKEVVGVDLDESVSWIRGEEGTKVTLTVERKNKSGEYEEMEVPITRGIVETKTVLSKMLKGHIGYIRISRFETVTYKQFAEALAELEDKKAKGLIVDLRNNPGGSLGTVCEILDLLLPQGTVVYTEDKNNQRQEYTSDEARSYDKPIYVLANENSASASEIFCGAIQDFAVGKIVGTTTYGKGVVQQVIDLKDGSCVKLTTSEYYTPKGREINKKGITPDIKVKAGKNDVIGVLKKDKQLREAVQDIL